MAELLCPKDQTAMRSIERNGVTIERCPECGGIFLDRGELERLTEAEGRYVVGDNPRITRTREEYDDHGSDHRGGHRDGDKDGHHGSGSSGPPQRKRKGFLADLLDFG